jgi:hypothetical protein
MKQVAPFLLLVFITSYLENQLLKQNQGTNSKTIKAYNKVKQQHLQEIKSIVIFKANVFNFD